MKLDSPVTQLNGVGPQMAKKLERLRLYTIADILFHLPNRYEDRTKVTSIAHASLFQPVVLVAQIESSQVVFGRRRSLVVRLSDGSGFINIRLFYFSQAQQKGFKRNHWLRCYGEVRQGPSGYELVHPEYKIFHHKPEGSLETCLTPVYPTTEGVSQGLLRKITDQALATSLGDLVDHIKFDDVAKNVSSNTQAVYQRISLQEAVYTLHRPPAQYDLNDLMQARSDAHLRLIIEELLAHQLSARKKKSNNQQNKAIQLNLGKELQQQFLQEIGFKLTQAQVRVGTQLLNDVAQATPSLRLVQGDVGSGKTVVAAMAILAAAQSNAQVAFMAPTELLAEQHYQTLSRWFKPLAIEVDLLTAKTVKSERQKILDMLSSSVLNVVVGTHALFQETVKYQNLALVIIDEQHRFGVEQRFALKDKRQDQIQPHQILMTATPIPRTLAMSLYADMDVSSIDEMPPGRQPVQTLLVDSEVRRQEVIEKIAHICQKNQQVYWVCSLIEESESFRAQAATQTQLELSQQLKQFNVGLIHGKLSASEKERAMAQFRDAEIHILVATTVIEVGVDVPNANLMVIENAERLGLAQLHQLRGRVGRGAEQAYCILLYQSPLSQHAKQRIQTIREVNDGFLIAERDLQMRGAGELLGTKQTGLPSFKVADLARDQCFLEEVVEVAKWLEKKQKPAVNLIISRWLESQQHYADV